MDGVVETIGAFSYGLGRYQTLVDQLKLNWWACLIIMNMINNNPLRKGQV